MKITVVTLFPKMIEAFISESIIKRAIDKKIIEIKIINLREFTTDKYRTVDDKPYGGGTGMVLKIEPVFKAITEIKKNIIGKKNHYILTSPRGIKYDQKKAEELSRLDNIVIFCGHYEGFDERISAYFNEEVSIGDYVLTGGEIAASVIIDSITRLIPNVLKKEEATQNESFLEIEINKLEKIVGENETIKLLKEKKKTVVKLLEYPQFTRPETFNGKKIPEILLSGNHKEIDKWRIKEAFLTTLKRRIDLLK